MIKIFRILDKKKAFVMEKSLSCLLNIALIPSLIVDIMAYYNLLP